VVGAVASLLLSRGASAQSSAGLDPQAAPDVVPSDPSVDATNPESGAPPVRPRPHGLVVESTLGVLAFAGQFRHVAPPAYWWRMQLGYEPTPWLMLFGAGELAFTDTGESQDESHTTAFPIWGISGGLRGTAHVTDRFAFYGQVEGGGLTADIAHNTLTVLGFRNAESFNASVGARVGVEWYQMDRHLALSASGGIEYATGFQKLVGPSDIPLLWSTGLALRYAF